MFVLSLQAVLTRIKGLNRLEMYCTELLNKEVDGFAKPKIGTVQFEPTSCLR